MTKKISAQQANIEIDTGADTTSSQPIHISITFNTLGQALLFERFIRRITKGNLQALMFDKFQTEELLTTLGDIRAPLKLIPRHRSDAGPELPVNQFRILL